jgi:hypothetical protein
LKISLVVGPMKKNPSKIPDSNIQCVVTSGTSSLWVFGFVAKKLATVEKKFYEEKKINPSESPNRIIRFGTNSLVDYVQISIDWPSVIFESLTRKRSRRD